VKKLVIILILLWFSSLIKSETYELSIPPNDTSTYEYADFKIWVNDSIDTLKGIYWFIHGFNGDSRQYVNEFNFQVMVSNNQFALMGVHLSNMHMHSGIGDAVLNFIDSISIIANRPEITNIPLFINGLSWGGQFGYHFAKWSPEKVLALISQKGGYHDTTTTNIAIDVPMLFFIGENDLQYRIDNLTNIFLNHRPLGAKWILAIEKNAAHEQIIDEQFLNTYFNEMVNIRLNSNSDFYQPIILNELTDSTSWLGDYDSLDIDLWFCYLSNSDSSSWLVNRKIATLWRRFSSDEILVEYNNDINEDCQTNIDDIFFMADVLLEKTYNNLFLDYNQDSEINIFDLFYFIGKISI
tara:strand:- start:2450 stop:3508 length:1059 start_codon:yes stop_codon:yes gene_type:complete